MTMLLATEKKELLTTEDGALIELDYLAFWEAVPRVTAPQPWQDVTPVTE